MHANAENKNEPQGHRERLRERISLSGTKNIENEVLLESLLNYCIPRRDTKPIAKKLLKEFHTLSGVFNADPHKLAAVEGIGENAVLFLRIVSEAAHRIKKTEVYIDTDKAKAIIAQKLSEAGPERVYGVYFNYEGKICGSGIICEGDINSAHFPADRILSAVKEAEGSFVVLAHNHPSGSPIPSGEDILSTKRIRNFLDEYGITLFAHYVYASGTFLLVF